MAEQETSLQEGKTKQSAQLKTQPLIPKLRFKEFDGEWKKKKIREILTIGSGKDYKHLENGNIPVFGTGGLMAKVNTALHSGKTVFIGRKGSIDKPFYFEGDFWTVDTLFYTHSFIESTPEFIYGLFQRINWYKHNEASGVPSLSKTTIGSLVIQIPSLPEQQKIASFLSTVDEKIQQLTQKKSLLEQYKKGVMQQLFSGKLRFKDENGENFPDWEIKEIGEFIKVRKISASPDTPLYSLTIEHGVVPKSKRYERSFLVKGEESAYKLMFPNDFAFNPMNLRFGALARYKGTENVAVSKYYDIFYCKENCNQDYLESYLTSYNMIQYYNKMSTGTLEEKKRVHYLDFVHFKKLFPCIGEQQKIADYLSAIDTKIETVNQQIEKTQAFKKGLLQQMFV